VDLGSQTVVDVSGRREVFARMVVRANPTTAGPTFRAILNEHKHIEDGVVVISSDLALASMPFTAEGIRATPWIPLPTIGKDRVTGWVGAWGSTTSGTGRIAFGRVELGELA